MLISQLMFTFKWNWSLSLMDPYQSDLALQNLTALITGTQLSHGQIMNFQSWKDYQKGISILLYRWVNKVPGPSHLVGKHTDQISDSWQSHKTARHRASCSEYNNCDSASIEELADLLTIQVTSSLQNVEYGQESKLTICLQVHKSLRPYNEFSYTTGVPASVCSNLKHKQQLRTI